MEKPITPTDLAKYIFSIVLDQCKTGEECISVACVVLETSLLVSLNENLTKAQVSDIVDGLAGKIKENLHENIQKFNKTMNEAT